MGTFIQDVRYALRMIARKPGTAAVVVLSLALGVGANTTIFSVINALLLRPPAVEQPERLVDIYQHVKTRGSGVGAYRQLNYPDFAYYRDHNTVFSALAGASGEGSDVVWSRDSQGQAVKGVLVTANYFAVLGVKPALGRTFLPEEDQSAGANPAVMVSHAFWEQRLGGDRANLSKPLTLNGRTYQLVGVVPASFHGVIVGSMPDVWIPMAVHQSVSPGLDLTSRNMSWLTATGRLKPGVTLQQARAEMIVLSEQIAQAFPETNKDTEAAAYPTSMIPGPFRGFLSILSMALMAVVGMVLLIACANAANLLLAQASARWREMAVRAALGANRWRLVRQTLTESVLLACMGGVAGLVLAVIAAPMVLWLKPPNIPFFLEIKPDWRVLTFTLVASVVTGLFFGLAPALHTSKLDLVSRLKDGTPGSGRVKSRLRSVLVTAQVAVCMVLLVGAGLCLRSLLNAQSIDPGFDTNRALVVSLNAETFGYDEARGRVLYKSLLDRVGALPGVRSVSLVDMMPLGTQSRMEGINVAGSQAGLSREGESGLLTGSSFVAPNYFRAIGIPVLRGREFTEKDNPGAPPVVIINEVLARHFWPGKDPLGQRILLGGPEDSKTKVAAEVVGVVKTGKYRSIGEDPQPFMYRAYWQNYLANVHVVVRTEGDPWSVMSGLRRAVQELDPNLAIFDAETMTELMRLPLFPAHTAGLLLGVFGGLALLLAMAGLYGVMSYLVAQRTQEVGVRMALGAQVGDILKLAVGEGMRLALIGVALGLAGAFAATRLLSSLLYGIRATDLVTFSAVSLLLTGVAFLASYIPARRAARVSPIVALRYE